MISDCWQSKRIIYHFIKSVQIITCWRNYFLKLFILNTILIRHFHPLCCLFCCLITTVLLTRKKPKQLKPRTKPILAIFYNSPEFAGTFQFQRYLTLGNFIFPLCYSLQVTVSGYRQGPGGILFLTHQGKCQELLEGETAQATTEGWNQSFNQSTFAG